MSNYQKKSKQINKIILINNLDILKLSRFKQVSQFLVNDPILFETILDSEISDSISLLCLEKIKLSWIDYLWQIALKSFEFEKNKKLKDLKMNSFIVIYREIIEELLSIDNKGNTDTYIDILNQKKTCINNLISIDLKSEKNLNKLKLEYRINKNTYNKRIKKLKNDGNITNV